MSVPKKIMVYADWENLASPRLTGVLHSAFSRGKEIFSFEYDTEWLRSSFARNMDPDLGLYAGRQFMRDEKNNFGMFLDSAPDRWGRVLMDRRESVLSRIENRQRRKLSESDYLLGVFDEYRMGALRFKTDERGAFLNDNRHFAAPPWTSLHELEEASYRLENDLAIDDAETLKWLKMLLAPGSSLGGARPKAGVADADGALWIAKFPSREDEHDVGAWEFLVSELARNAGLNVAQTAAQRFYGKHHTFLSRRFDRTPARRRLHFASAMTLLGYTDGTDFHDGASYLELAEFIVGNGACVKADLNELFRRIVFSICVSNTDDHLRNHGFLLVANGWTLSPAYDMNPNPYGTGLKLNVSDNDNSLDLNLALEVAPFFRLKTNEAKQIVAAVGNSVDRWSEIAASRNIPKKEQDAMSVAFR
jgi:serine/threonine-protein kinase HipA